MVHLVILHSLGVQLYHTRIQSFGFLLVPDWSVVVTKLAPCTMLYVVIWICNNNFVTTIFIITQNIEHNVMEHTLASDQIKISCIHTFPFEMENHYHISVYAYDTRSDKLCLERWFYVWSHSVFCITLPYICTWERSKASTFLNSHTPSGICLSSTSTQHIKWSHSQWYLHHTAYRMVTLPVVPPHSI